MTKPIAVVGAGLSGATAACLLARNGFDVEVYEIGRVVGGNCHTYRDKQTGIQVHTHGPHIFHTNKSMAWDFVTQFAEFQPYVQRTKAISHGQLFSFPINLHTLSELYCRTFTPQTARQMIESETRFLPAMKLDTMEGYLLTVAGPRVYEKFFRDYTIKQWGRHPHDLPMTVAMRIPLRFNFDDRAFTDKYQGIPTHGYAQMIENMLDHPRIKVFTHETFPLTGAGYFKHAVYTGPLDEAFDYKHGHLPYRTLKFAHEVLPDVKDAQGCSVINWCDDSVPWTRATEHKHFTPWEADGVKGTIVTREFPEEWNPSSTTGRYYPVRLAREERTLMAYENDAMKLDGVTFMGRLGRFEYLNMDQAVMLALAGTKEVMRRIR